MAVAEVSFERNLALDVVANNAAKALAYMALWDLGEATRPGLGKYVSKRFELHHRDPGTIGAYAVTFARFGFAEEYSAQSQYSSREVSYYEAANGEEAIPAIGASLDWSRQYGTAICKILGVTSSPSSESRAPSNSISILDGILKGVNIHDIPCHGYANGPDTTRLRDLVAEGIIIKDDSDNRFLINDPTYRGNRPYESLLFPTRHTYRTLQLAKELAPERKWAAEEVWKLAVSLLPEKDREDEILQHELRRSIAAAASLGDPADFAGAVHKTTLRRGKYKIADTHQESVADLVERAKRLAAREPKFLKKCASYAHYIYSDTDLAHDLVTRDAG